MSNEIRDTAEYLIGLGNGSIKPEWVYSGIFGHLSKLGISYKLEHRIQKLVSQWSEFSGCNIYPIGDSEEAAYDLFWDPAIPNWKGEYGAARKRLATWLGEQLLKEIEGECS